MLSANGWGWIKEGPDAKPQSALWIMNALRLILLVQAGFSLLHRHGYLTTLCLLVILISFFPVLSSVGGIRLSPLLQYLAIEMVLASLLLGEGVGYYERFWWWDISLHGVSGLLLGAMGSS